MSDGYELSDGEKRDLIKLITEGKGRVCQVVEKRERVITSA